METSEPDTVAAPIDSADVVAAVGRVLASREFRRSPRAREFLACVYGHMYSKRANLDGWVASLAPDGWSAADTDKLGAILEARRTGGD